MKSFWLVAGVSITALAAIPAVAQTGVAVAPPSPPPANAAGAPVDPTEIIVTAQKRAQSINEVGLTIQAASGQELATRGIAGPSDLAKLVPGFTYTQSIYSTPVYTLRGIGLYDATFGASPSVSIYTDEIPRNVPVMSDALDLDIERIEVLKGPQGTLFGQSSTGGAINYIVGKPTRDLRAGFYTSYERFGRMETSGYISGPLGDKVAARLAVKGVAGGAWQHSLSRPSDENGATRKIMGRLTIDLKPTDRIKIQLMATGSKDQSDPLAPQYDGAIYNIYSAAALAAANANPATQNPFGYVDNARYTALTDPTSNSYDATFLPRQSTLVSRLNGTDVARATGARAVLGTRISTNARDAEWTAGLLGKSHNDYYQFSGRADIDLTDAITLTSITAVARQRLDYAQDLDATTAVVGDVPIFGSVKTFNQEVRIAGKMHAINWLAGVSYDDLRSVQDNFFRLSDYSGNDPLGDGRLITLTKNDFSSHLKSYAAFANVEIKPTPQLTLQGGIRYTNNKQSASYCYNDPAIDLAQNTARVFHIFEGLFGNPGLPDIKPGECFVLGDGLRGTTFGKSTRTPVNRDLKEHNISFRVGANYKFDGGTLVYATVSQGFKAGIFSAIGASTTSQYSEATQEKVIAYEAGFKAPLADKHVQLNAAVFYYDYSNKQVRGRIRDNIYGLLEKLLNVPKSYVLGVEGELVVRPIRGLRLSSSATYLKTRVTSDYSSTPDGLDIYNAQGYKGNFKGSELPYTPNLSGNADIEYQFPVTSSLNAFAGGTVVYQGKQNATFHNALLLAQEFNIPGYTTVDARLGVTSADTHWKASLFGRNILNKSYTTGISTYLDTRLRYRGRPVTYGLSIGYNY